MDRVRGRSDRRLIGDGLTDSVSANMTLVHYKAKCMYILGRICLNLQQNNTHRTLPVPDSNRDLLTGMAEEIKILTPIGMLGYSFSENLFWSAIEDGVDAIILDSGSTDSGPAKLALGQTTVSRQAYERDLGILVSACHYYRVPVLIGMLLCFGHDRTADCC